VVTQSRPLNHDDLQLLREMRHERLELIDGELVVTPSPTPMHQRVSRRLSHLLGKFIIDTESGEFFAAPLDVYLAVDTVVQPDLIVLLNDRFRLVTERNIEGPPNLVMEIISPSTRHLDHRTKLDVYARFGVPEYWLVDPEHETISIFTDPQEGRYQREAAASTVAVSVTIPGLVVELKGLFDRGPGN
jgi:Uma2 family endonuclease